MAHKSRFYKDLDDEGRLDLSLQNLREVPVDDLLQLGKKLKSLDLAKNQLTSLPDRFGELVDLVELDLGDNGIAKLPESFGFLFNLRKVSFDNNALTNLPESWINLKKVSYLDLKGNPLSAHLQDAAGACFTNRDCELAASRVMKFQKVYAEACEKKRAKEDLKREAELKLERAKKKEEKQAEKLRRRKIWEEEQLRKKMENEIFGNFEKSDENGVDSQLNENESNSSVVEEIKSKKENSKSSFLKYFVIFILILIAYFLFIGQSD